LLIQSTLDPSQNKLASQHRSKKLDRYAVLEHNTLCDFLRRQTLTSIMPEGCSQFRWRFPVNDVCINRRMVMRPPPAPR
jgi:hypothetical protein